MTLPFPKISIVTTCLNDAAFLEETLSSIHNQGYPNLDHIVVDGGSTDGSVEIIKKYSDRLSWWCSEPDRGHGDALAKGFAHASGEILTWVCSDDVLLPGALAAVAAHFDHHKGCRWLDGSGLIIGEQGEVIEHVFAVPMSLHSIVFWQFWGAVQPAIFFSREALEAAGGVDGSFNLSPDLDLCLRLARGGSSCALPDFTAALRIYGDTQSTRREAEMRAVDHKLRQREGLTRLPPWLRKILYIFYNQRFLAWQRLGKLLLRAGLGPGRTFKRELHWRTLCP